MANEIRQGDVVLIPVEGATPPDTAKKAKLVILAEGEATGHAHRLSSEAGVLEWDDPTHGRMVWVVGPERGILHHEDHDPAPADVVPAGVAHRVGIQRELTLSGQFRQVVD